MADKIAEILHDIEKVNTRDNVIFNKKYTDLLASKFDKAIADCVAKINRRIDEVVEDISE